MTDTKAIREAVNDAWLVREHYVDNRTSVRNIDVEDSVGVVPVRDEIGQPSAFCFNDEEAVAIMLLLNNATNLLDAAEELDRLRAERDEARRVALYMHDCDQWSNMPDEWHVLCNRWRREQGDD
jgi:hypothetical protein